MKWLVKRSTLHGTSAVPGDKSIAHRALMFAGLARGDSTIHNLPDGEDVLSTLVCMEALGAHISRQNGTALIYSDGQLRAPAAPLDAGNSGTTTRLLAGILAGQSFFSRLDGDASLRRRPMSRVVEPLGRMGADIRSQNGCAPLDIQGQRLSGIEYTLPVPSAQIKSALLLAGLFADGVTSVHEVVPARDHTERMMEALGVNVRISDGTVAVQGGRALHGFTCSVPGDMSSATFLFGAAACGGGEVTVTSVGLNPTRSPILEVLRRMGAVVRTEDTQYDSGEPRGAVTVIGPINAPVQIGPDEIPGLVDELPLIALLATQADGESTIHGAAELRVKETDRLAAVTTQLTAMGANIMETADGWNIRGKTPLTAARVNSVGDHRMAMMLAVAGSIAKGTTEIAGAEAAAVSFPTFGEVFTKLGGSLESE